VIAVRSNDCWVCSYERSGCWRCCGVLLVEFENNLRAHTGPEHHIDLKNGEQSRHRAIMSNVVPIEDIASSVHIVSNVGGEFANPNTIAGRTSR
jgi:hypothetical protein